MDRTPANSCLYGHPLLWRKTTNILQLQTWLHILRHAPSNSTFQSQQHHWPQEKATITLKLLSIAVLALMDAWITDWIMGLKQREQSRRVVSSGYAGEATFQGREGATQTDLFAFIRFCYHSWGGLLSTYTSLLLVLAEMGPSALHFWGIQSLSCLLPFVHQKQRWKNGSLELILKGSPCQFLLHKCSTCTQQHLVCTTML